MTIKDIKKGGYFTLKEISEPNGNQVYVKGEYDKKSKAYSCCKFSDVNYERFFKGDKVVFTDFTF
jgi:folate-dependent tRNA-U54 methylase TrmFO/GidA